MEKIMKLSPPPPQMMGAMGGEMSPEKMQQMQMNLIKQAPKLIAKLSKMDPGSCSDQFKLTVVQVIFFCHKLFFREVSAFFPQNATSKKVCGKEISLFSTHDHDNDFFSLFFCQFFKILIFVSQTMKV